MITDRCSSCLYGCIATAFFNALPIRAITLLLMVLSPAFALAMGWPGEDLDGAACNGKDQGYGPYDYRNPAHRQKNLTIVETHHFGRSIRNLSQRPLYSLKYNLDYTLRAFPNHHQALFSLIKLETEFSFEKEYFREYQTPPECYLQRAQAFAKNDENVQLLFGIYLHRKDIFDEALRHYEKALSINSRSADAHYNIGLLLLDMDRPEDALEHARRAYELGYALDGLKNRLARAGYQLE